MSINFNRLQEVVDKMAITNPNGTWDLDHEYASEFFKIITPYVNKAAYKSDRYDPENTAAEVSMCVWKALKKYGPRPHGNKFACTLLLQTKNCLRNMYKKRESYKSRLNYICESLDNITEKALVGQRRHDEPSTLPTDSMAFKKEVKRYSEKGSKRMNVEDILNYTKKFDDEEKKKLFFGVMAQLLEINQDDITNLFLTSIIKLLPEDLGKLYYNKESSKRKNMLDINKIKVGDQLVTHTGLLIEVRKLLPNGFKVFVFATEKEIQLPKKYFEIYEITYLHEKENVVVNKDLGCAFEQRSSKKATNKNPYVKQEPETSVEEKDLSLIAIEPTKVEKQIIEPINVEIQEKPIIKSIAISKKETEIAEEFKAKRITIKDYIINSLSRKECSVSELANGIIRDKISKEEDLYKIKSVVNSTIYFLKTKDKINVERCSRGVYKILKEEKFVVEDTKIVDDVKLVEETKMEPKKEKRVTIRAFVLEMLQTGTFTKDAMAQAIIDRHLSKQVDLEKVKNQVAFIMSNLKKKDGVKVVRVEGGLYKVEK